MAESTVAHWDTLWEQHKDEPVHDRELRRIAEIYRKLNGSLKDRKVLEAGAGSAIDSIMLAKKTGCKPVCVDYSAKSIAFIEENFKKHGLRGTYVEADIRKLPFKAGTFDVIFSNGVLEHFKNPMQIVKEQQRVLKQNGLLVIGVPETYSLYTVKKHIQMRLGTWFAGWETQYSARQMRRMAEDAGLTVLDVTVYGNAPLWFPTWLKKVCTLLRLNRILASDVVVYATK